MDHEATFFDVLQRHARHQPGKVAVRQIGGTTLTYGELGRMAAQFRTRFIQMPDPVRGVPLCTARSPACVAAVVAALGAGRAFACLNQKLRPPQIAEILQALRARVAVVDAVGMLMLRGWEETGAALDTVDWWELPGVRWTPLLDRIAEGLPMPCRMDSPILRKVALPESHGAEDKAQADDPACYLFTSGSTGAQKGVRISRGDLHARVEAEIATFGIGSDDVLLSVLPFSFDVGLNQMLTAVLCGATLVVTDSWMPPDLMRAVADWKVTGISCVPSIWTGFVRGGFAFDTDAAHRSLRYVTVSGGDLGADDLRRLDAATGAAGIFKTYGQTEAFRSTCLRPGEFTRKPTSVGRPLENCCVYIVDEEERPVRPGDAGQIVHTGVGTMLGYLDADTATDKLRMNPYHGPEDPNPTAVFTGDQGRLDEDGFLHVLGRRDQMAKIRGNRVYPDSVANALGGIEGVDVAEVLAIPDINGMDHLVAFVVRTRSDGPDAATITQALSSYLPSFMVPEHIRFRPILPLTASGKPDRKCLHEEALRVVTASDQQAGARR